MSKWQNIRLGDIADFSNGINFDKSSYCENGTYLIGVSDFGEELFPDYSTLRHIDSTIVRECNLLKDGDIVFVRSNGNKALVGRSMLIKNPPKNTSFSGFCIRARIKNHESFDPLFFAYLFKSENFRKAIAGCSIGANIQNLSQGKLASYMAYVPPIEEQRKIADVLSAYDDLIENNRKQIKLLEEAAQRLYKEWFIDLRFPGHETTNIINGIPAGWERKKLIEIADITMGQSPKSEFYNNTHDGLPFHQGVGSFGTRFVIDETYSSSFSRVAESGDILFSVRAPVGRLNITLNKIAIGRGLAAIKHKNNLQSFLYYMLKEHFFKDDIIGNGSIFASITKDELTNFVLLVPRQDICEKFNTLTKDIDSKIMILDKQIQGIKETRDRLLPKLMNGELEVERCPQDL